MTSKRRFEILDLESGVLTSPEDLAALERARKLDHLSPEEYLRFLLTFSASHPPGRDIPPHHEPFRL